jgi:hypothetical protein
MLTYSCEHVGMNLIECEMSSYRNAVQNTSNCMHHVIQGEVVGLEGLMQSLLFNSDNIRRYMTKVDRR